MKEVTKEEFYGIIKKEKLDLVYEPIGMKSPFTGIFKFRNEEVWGKIVPSEVDSKKYPKYPWYIEHYYIM